MRNIVRKCVIDYAKCVQLVCLPWTKVAFTRAVPKRMIVKDNNFKHFMPKLTVNRCLTETIDLTLSPAGNL
jgi:hypothetical protein